VLYFFNLVKGFCYTICDHTKLNKKSQDFRYNNFIFSEKIDSLPILFQSLLGQVVIDWLNSASNLSRVGKTSEIKKEVMKNFKIIKKEITFKFDTIGSRLDLFSLALQSLFPILVEQSEELYFLHPAVMANLYVNNLLQTILGSSEANQIFFQLLRLLEKVPVYNDSELNICNETRNLQKFLSNDQIQRLFYCLKKSIRSIEYSKLLRRYDKYYEIKEIEDQFGYDPDLDIEPIMPLKSSIFIFDPKRDLYIDSNETVAISKNKIYYIKTSGSWRKSSKQEVISYLVNVFNENFENIRTNIEKKSQLVDKINATYRDWCKKCINDPDEPNECPVSKIYRLNHDECDFIKRKIEN